MHRIYKRMAALIIGLLIAAAVSVGEWAQWEVLTNAEMAGSAPPSGAASDTLNLDNKPPPAGEGALANVAGRPPLADQQILDVGTKGASAGPKVGIEARQTPAFSGELKISGVVEEKLLGDLPVSTHDQRASAFPESRQPREQESVHETVYGPHRQLEKSKATHAASRRTQKKARSATATRRDAQALIGQIARAKTADEAMVRLEALRRVLR